MEKERKKQDDVPKSAKSAVEPRRWDDADGPNPREFGSVLRATEIPSSAVGRPTQELVALAVRSNREESKSEATRNRNGPIRIPKCEGINDRSRTDEF